LGENPDNRNLVAALLVLSDRCARGERTDTSGPALVEWLAERRVRIGAFKLLPDDRLRITALLRAWCDDGQFDLILTCGGTGVAPRDVTPEATTDVVDRLIPGLAELMRLRSLDQSPHAALSRAIAGVRGQTLVLNLPGSPRAALENLAAAWPAVGHAVAKIQGDPSDCGQTADRPPDPTATTVDAAIAAAATVAAAPTAVGPDVPLAEVTAAILAGGHSRRMGQDKALLQYRNGKLIEAVYAVLARLFQEILIVAKRPELYRFLPARAVTDALSGDGPLVGIHAALQAATTPFVFVVGCDMPSLQPSLIRDLAGRCAVPAFFDRVQTLIVPRTELESQDPDLQSFRNVNTPEDIAELES
jgi:molybdenum cofactor synthesis domain-containing protein